MLVRLRNWLVGWLFGWEKVCPSCRKAKGRKSFVRLPYYSAGGLCVCLYPLCKRCFGKLDPHIIMWHCEVLWSMMWEKKPREFPIKGLAQSIMEEKEKGT